MIAGLLVALVLYASVFGLAEILYRRGARVQVTRKIAHIGGGIITSALPLLTDLPMALGLGLFFSVVLIWTRKTGLLNSVHQAKNHTIGAILFPISLLLCAGLYWNIDPLIFQGAALILGLSDGLAGIIGQKIGKKSYWVTGHKTVEGSFVFFAVTFFLLLVLSFSYQNTIGLPRLLAITVAALSLTATEGLFSHGWDNLPVPLLGGLAIYYLIK